MKPISDQVIVITGASSGIGLATAVDAARQGAGVVLAARNGEALRDVALRMRDEGARVAYVAADVGKAEDVERIGETALRRFGRIDTWVNNAGVDIWGRIENISNEDNRKLFETNFWGTVYGSQVAVRHMRDHGGTLINVGSIAGDRAFPLQGMYCASKHAIRGFTEALRMELEADDIPVRVSLIKPASVGTPLQRQARNYLPEEPRLPSPLYRPEEVAMAILHCAVHPLRDVYVGGVGKVLTSLAQNMPRTTDVVGENLLISSQMSGEPARPRQDNLHAAGPGGGVIRDDPENRTMKRSAYTRMALRPQMPGVLLALVGFGLAAIGANRPSTPPDRATRTFAG